MWVENGHLSAKVGNAAGAGGTAVNIGSPLSGGVPNGPANSVTLGEQLVVVKNIDLPGRNPREGRWVNVIPAPP